MTLTDEELDREWKPNGRRPQSTIARSFSAELMDIFKIDSSVADLDAEVDKRKQTVETQTSELESLEQRIREMEERLRRSQTPARRPIPADLQTRSSRGDGDRPPPVPKDIQVEKSRSRPGSSRTARAAPSSGAMPPTPVASEGEYDIVDKADLEDDEVERSRRA